MTTSRARCRVPLARRPSLRYERVGFSLDGPAARPSSHATPEARGAPLLPGRRHPGRAGKGGPGREDGPAAREPCSHWPPARARPSSPAISCVESPTPGSSGARCSCATATNCAPRGEGHPDAFGNDAAQVSWRQTAGTEERPRPRRHLPDARHRRPTAATSSSSALSRELFHPHRHRRVPPLRVGQVVKGADTQLQRRPDRPHRHAPPDRLPRRLPGGTADAITADNLSTSASRSTSTASPRASRTATWRPARSGAPRTISTPPASTAPTSLPRSRNAITGETLTVAEIDAAYERPASKARSCTRPREGDGLDLFTSLLA